MTSKQPVNILMVDDQPAKLLTYESILSDLGENLVRATSGMEGLERLLRDDFAVVLVDVCMPGMDGFELTSLIRGHPRFQKTSIILISGVLVADVDRLKGYVSGAVDYISVPIIPEILRAKVSVFADLYRKTEELYRLNVELEQRVAERTAETEAAAARLRQSEERLRLVLSAGGIQGWTWQIQENEFTWVTPLGDTVSVHQPLADYLSVVHPADRSAVQDTLDRAVRGEAEFYAEFRTEEAGEERWWLGSGTVIRDLFGRPQSIAGINTDITARKRAEEERGILLKKTEDARREAETANRLKDEFLATLSHELRTPLNAITGWAHLLQAGDLGAATQSKAIETINRNAQLQANLISDLLDVSRIVSGKLRLDTKPIEFAPVVLAAIDAFRPAAEAKGIQIHTELLCDVSHINGDPARLQQVAGNLLSNAIKFTPYGGQIQIRIEKSQSHLELTVQDDGPGIPPDFLPYIFESFRQADSTITRSHHGLGLGLGITRHLVMMHGGDVTARNREDRSGAIFKALLPLCASSVEAASEIRTRPPYLPEGEARPGLISFLQGTRILVVDDDMDSRELVALSLNQNGAKVILAASASEALEILARELPDVLIADIGMPGEDGHSLIRRVRALPPERGGLTPAVALTAYASNSDSVKILKSGFERHVPKPVHPPALISIIASLVRPNEKHKRSSRDGSTRDLGTLMIKDSSY